VAKDMDNSNQNNDKGDEYLSLTQHYATIANQSMGRRGTIEMVHESIQNEDDDDAPPPVAARDDGQPVESTSAPPPSTTSDDIHAFEVLLERLTKVNASPSDAIPTTPGDDTFRTLVLHLHRSTMTGFV
ncbi:hypothetical protein DYB32_010482, partial [Aphanomyces invadans]